MSFLSVSRINKFIFLFFLLAAFLIPSLSAKAEESIEIYFFWGEGCPHCRTEKEFLDELKQEFPQIVINDFEIYRNSDNLSLMQELGQAYDVSIRGIPVLFIGQEAIIGFGGAETTGRQIRSAVENCLLSGCISPIEKLNPEADQEITQTCAHFFIKEDCENCLNLVPYLEQVAEAYNIDLRTYNISESDENREIYQSLLSHYQIPSSGLPILFMGETYLLGEERIRQNIESVATYCHKNNCSCPIQAIGRSMTQLPRKGDFVPSEEIFKLNLLGRSITVTGESSLLWLTVVLGLVDGINPCTLSVLFFLLTYLLAIGSRQKAVKVGLAFVLTVFVVYLIFMLGILNLIAFIGAIHTIKIVVAIIALVAGLIMLKDFFWYGRGFSLEIPKKFKPSLEKLVKRGTIPSAIVLGVLASLVELPCTSGIPLVYATVLAQQQIAGLASLPYLAAYNFFYIVPLLIVILLIAFVLLKMETAENWRLRMRKYMRLVSAIILIFFGFALLFGWM
jgi:cytochrome c biogenesis protein CcdA/thiol-disulfide isomerase/thioredoxin